MTLFSAALHTTLLSQCLHSQRNGNTRLSFLPIKLAQLPADVPIPSLGMDSPDLPLSFRLQLPAPASLLPIFIQSLLNKVFPQGSTAKPVRDFRAFPYRMNLVAASRRIPKIFIADEDQIRIITTPNGTGPCDALKFESAIPRQFADDESTGYLVPQFV